MSIHFLNIILFYGFTAVISFLFCFAFFVILQIGQESRLIFLLLIPLVGWVAVMFSLVMRLMG